MWFDKFLDMPNSVSLLKISVWYYKLGVFYLVSFKGLVNTSDFILHVFNAKYM